MVDDVRDDLHGPSGLTDGATSRSGRTLRDVALDECPQDGVPRT